MKRVLEAVAKQLTQETKLKVLFDPQPVKSAEPHLRLTYIGSQSYGPDSEGFDFQLSLVGSGDGPDVFLPALLTASAKLDSLYDKCEGPLFRDLKIDSTTYVRMTFVTGLIATGSFTQNEMKIVETNQWSYLWQEPRQMTLVVPKDYLLRR